MDGSKVMFALLLMTALTAVVAIIISAVTLSRPSAVPTITLNGLGGGQQTPVVMQGGGGGQCSNGQANGRKTYLVAISNSYIHYSYFDEKNYHQGFTRDLVTEVCQLAGIECRIVVDSIQNCWQSRGGDHPTGGQGIMNGWYDACAGLTGTHERIQVFDYSVPFTPASKTRFWFKKGSGFDWEDLTGKNIGFKKGVTSDHKCVARQSGIKANVLSGANAKYYDTREGFLEGFQKGEIDAAFGGDSTMPKFLADHNVTDIVPDSSPGFQCTVQGHSVVTRKDNDFIPHWNRGFNMMKMSGRYDKLCEEAREKHGHKGEVKCF